MSKQEQELMSLSLKLNTLHSMNKKILVGFDGFIDEVLHVVKTRSSDEKYERMEYLIDYGNMIAESAGVSLNVEMVPIRKKLGGNGAICANALSALGAKVTFIGTCGYPEVKQEFIELQQNAEVISIGEPAYTNAIEFRDGKIISSKLENLREISWNRILEEIGTNQFIHLIEESTLIAFMNWTMIMSMSDMWEHILEDILPHVKMRYRTKLFVDLADPSKRTRTDILHAIHLLEQFNTYFEVVLGINKKEAKILYSILIKNKEPDDITKLVEGLMKKIRISKIVVHTAANACASDGTDLWQMKCPVCAVPKQTTGAGDNFNAGYMFGEISGLSTKDALVLGIANAGYYVRNAKSATQSEVQRFLVEWSKEKTGS